MNYRYYKLKMKPFKDTYVMYQLLEFINENSILCLCKASKKLNEICDQYLEMEDDKRFEINVSKHMWANTKLLRDYCRNNDIVKIRKIIKIDIKLMWNYGLYSACSSGHMNIVTLMIEKGATDWNHGLGCACYNCHVDIVKILIEKGADWCWNCKKSMIQHLQRYRTYKKFEN